MNFVSTFISVYRHLFRYQFRWIDFYFYISIILSVALLATCGVKLEKIKFPFLADHVKLHPSLPVHRRAGKPWVTMAKHWMFAVFATLSFHGKL